MLNKKTLVVFSLILSLMIVGTADAKRVGRLIGKVIDQDGNPIEGVTVKATSDEVPDYSAVEVTDDKGIFKLDFEELDRVYKYEFSKTGYHTLLTEQTWEKAGTARHTFTLTPGKSTAIGDETAIVTNSEAGAAYEAAVAAFEDGDLATAESKFKEAIELDSELRQAWVALSAIQLEEGHYEDAATSAEKAIEMGSTEAAVYRTRWEAYRQLGDEEMTAKAAADLEESGRLTEEAKRIYNEGVAALKAEDKQGAFVKFKQALDADPNLEPALFAVAATGLEIGEFAESVAAAEAILRNDPSNADALRLRYNAAIQLDDEEKLMDALVGLAAVEPEVAKQGLWLLAMTAYNANDNERSKERFEKVLEVDPNNAQAHYLLGLVYLGEDDRAKTKEHLERYVELAPPDDPDMQAAQDILSYLKSTS